MGRTLFVGCSHSMGYWVKGEHTPPHKWQDNNYAEIYASKNNKPVVIMASAGSGNRSYPRFVANAFKIYDDIDEVFLQTTYWGRFPIAINPDLDEKKIFPIDFFLQKEKSSDLIDRYSWNLYQDDARYVEYYVKPETYDYEETPYNIYTQPLVSEPDVRRSGAMYMRMWHHSNTHLEQEDFFTYIAMCDMICKNNSVPLHVWNINDRCYLPKETKNYYTDLTSTNIAQVSAEEYLKKYMEIDTIDGEHYSLNVHDAIADRYIPYVKDTK